MESLMSCAASPSSYKTARDRRFLLPPASSAANDLPYHGQGVVRRVVLHAGTELGVSLFGRPSARHHHPPAVGRSRIVKYKSAAAVDERHRPRLRLACHQQGLDHPGSLQRRMEQLRLQCQGLGLRPDYFDGNPEDIDVDITSNHNPPCSGTTLALGLPPQPTSSRCCDAA